MKDLVGRSLYRRLPWLVGLAVVATVCVPTVGLVLDRVEQRGRAEAAQTPPTWQPVAALGRVQPRDGVVALAGFVPANGAAIVATLHVREGDAVRAGQVLATMRGSASLEARAAAMQRRASVAQARLQALTSGGKHDDLTAQDAEVQKSAATLRLEQADLVRTEQLHGDGLVPTASLDAQRARVALAARSHDAALARLGGLSSVRPADVQVARHELATADADRREVEAQLEESIVRAPADGRILEIRARPGQRTGEDGVLAFGATAVMYVDTEVPEEDLPRLRVGQRARITGAVLTDPVAGTVEEVGALIGAREVFAADPAAFAHARVARVRVRADRAEVLARFVNARVTVSFAR
ncbi:MAG TPA: HlyD family efflux transporter periplasmic adaptor subunit [Luteitalea sp.]|nr:HlyD family efflux transporter periplasmic adaptor subunit [Luteitalea sp.]